MAVATDNTIPEADRPAGNWHALTGWELLAASTCVLVNLLDGFDILVGLVCIKAVPSHQGST